jgi:hypothetical protein
MAVFLKSARANQLLWSPMSRFCTKNGFPVICGNRKNQSLAVSKIGGVCLSATVDTDGQVFVRPLPAEFDLYSQSIYKPLILKPVKLFDLTTSQLSMQAIAVM